jgi:hypothetical protein
MNMMKVKKRWWTRRKEVELVEDSEYDENEEMKLKKKRWW